MPHTHTDRGHEEEVEQGVGSNGAGVVVAVAGQTVRVGAGSFRAAT